jgi:dihydrofolate reductase
VIAIVVAHARNGVIGRDGGLPWHLPSDLKHFRELTSGHTVVMGRRTYESLPDRFRPLPNRRNVVLSTNPAYVARGAEVFTSLASALDGCDDTCFVIGGEATYRQALPLSDRVYATQLEAEHDGDASFPDLPEAEWRCVDASEPLTENDQRFTFRTYERVR